MPTQKAWLGDRLAAFIEAQKQNKVQAFLTATNYVWFIAFPEIDALFPLKDGEECAPLTSDQERDLQTGIKNRKKVSF